MKPGKAQKELSTFAAKYREGAETTRGSGVGEHVVLQLEQSLLNAPIQAAKQLLTRAPLRYQHGSTVHCCARLAEMRVKFSAQSLWWGPAATMPAPCSRAAGALRLASA